MSGNDSGEQFNKDELNRLADMDPIAMAADWFDDGSRLYFSAGAVVYLISEVKKKAPSHLFKNVFGDVWNYFDVVSSFVVSANVQQKINDVKYNHESKETIMLINENMSMLSLFSTTMTTLTQFGVIKGMPAIVFAPMATFAFAAGMWATMGIAIKQLSVAQDKTNMAYLANECLLEYEHINQQRELLNKIRQIKINKQKNLIVEDAEFKIFYQTLQNDAKKYVQEYLYQDVNALSHKINQLNDDQIRLKNQALAIYRVNKNNQEFSYEKDPLIGEKITINSEVIKSKLASIDVSSTELEKQVNNEDIKLVNYLQAKANDKVLQRQIEVVEWGLAAVGMTLIAFSHYLPVLAIPGILFICTAALLKISSVITKHLSDSDKMDNYARKLIENNDNHIKTKIAALKGLAVFKDKDFSDNQLLSYRAAFELSVKDYDKNDDVRYEEAFYKKITEMSCFSRRRFLNDARDTYISQRFVSNNMGEFFLQSTTKKEHAKLVGDSRFFHKVEDKESNNKPADSQESPTKYS